MKEEYDNYKDLITDAMAEMTENMISCAEQICLKNDYSAYERGLNDAWECAKKIYSMSAQGVIAVFGGCSCWVNYSASEAIAKIKAYEKQVSPISIDEAINNLKHGSSIPYKRETLTLAIKALEQMKGAKE